MNIFSRFITVLTICSALAACSTLSNTSSDSKLIENQTWVLKTLQGEMPIEDKRITLSFQSTSTGMGKVSGRAPCNSYFGSYKHQNKTVSFEPMASTKMACSPQLMKQEMVFLSMFSEVNQIQINDHYLTLKNSRDNDKQMTYIAESAHIKGSVISTEGIFPTGSRLTVSLEDVSLQDAPSITLGEQVIPFDKARKPPIQFDLIYAPDLIKEGHSYSVSAKVRNSDGGLAYISTSHFEADFKQPMTIQVEPGDH